MDNDTVGRGRVRQIGRVRLTWASLVSQMVKNPPIMQEIQVLSLGQEDPLEKGMAIHPSILAWRILRTEEPGGLQAIGSQRVRHNWATNTSSRLTYIHSIMLNLQKWQFHMVQSNNYWYPFGRLPCGSTVKNLPSMQETRVQSLGWEDPLE